MSSWGMNFYRKWREAREEGRQQEEAEYAAFFDALMSIFGSVQNNQNIDGVKQLTAQRINPNLLKPDPQVSDAHATSATNLQMPSAGLYAMIMEKTTSLSAEGEPTEQQNSAWGYALNRVKSVKKLAGFGLYRVTGKAVADALFGGDDGFKAAESLEILDFPEYNIFIFADIGPRNPIPTMDKVATPRMLTPMVKSLFTDVESYPKAIITDRILRDEAELPSGCIIRVSYDNPENQNRIIIQEIVENDSEFCEIVLRSLGAKKATTAEQECSTDSVLTNTAHATGDPIGTESNVEVKRNIAGNNTVIYPFRPNTEVNLVVFFHGLEPFKYDGQSKSGQEILLASAKKLPVSSTMFLFPNGWGADWSGIQQAIDALSQHGITIKSKRLGAWSKGSFGFVKALEAPETGGASYFDAGTFLADPSPSTNAFGSDFSKVPAGVYMEYNPKVWESIPSLKNNFPAMIGRIVTSGGQQFLKSELNHAGILDSVITILNT